MTCVFFHYFSPNEFLDDRLQETTVLLDSLLHLAKNVKQHLKLNQVELVCRLVECLVTVIVLHKKGTDLQEESTVLKNESSSDRSLSTSFKLEDVSNEMSLFWKKQFQLVEDFMVSKLSYSLEYTKFNEWCLELQVSNS